MHPAVDRPQAIGRVRQPLTTCLVQQLTDSRLFCSTRQECQVVIDWVLSGSSVYRLSGLDIDVGASLHLKYYPTLDNLFGAAVNRLTSVL